MKAIKGLARGKKVRAAVRAIFSAILPGISILAAYFLLVRIGLYEVYPLLDNPLHFFEGAAIAWAVLRLWRYGQGVKILPKLPIWVAVSYAVGIAAIIGILWEQYEFFFDLWRGWNLSPNLADFIKDLTNDLLGAFIFAVFSGKVIFGIGRK
jgi:hypothetical protein